MDSGNSGSISSSGDEQEYDSLRPDHSSSSPPLFLNHPPHPSPSLFDFSSSTYLLHPLPLSLPLPPSQPSPSTPPLPLLAPTLPSSSPPMNHSSVLAPNLQPPTTINNNNNNNAARTSKKRTRASRRAPTTVLTTDTTNFRSMVQEFTGIPAPPFSSSSSSSYSRRLDLFAGSSSLRSAAASSHHLDPSSNNIIAFHPLRPFPQKPLLHPNPLLPPSMTNMVDAMASTTTSAAANNAVNFHHDIGLPYHHQQAQSMQNHPFFPFNPPPPIPLVHNTPFNTSNTVPAGFGANKSLEDLVGHEHVASDDGGGRRDPFRSLLDGKVASSGGGAGAGARGLNSHEKNASSTRGEGTAVDSWICSSD